MCHTHGLPHRFVRVCTPSLFELERSAHVNGIQNLFCRTFADRYDTHTHTHLWKSVNVMAAIITHAGPFQNTSVCCLSRLGPQGKSRFTLQGGRGWDGCILKRSRRRFRPTERAYGSDAEAAGGAGRIQTSSEADASDGAAGASLSPGPPMDGPGPVKAKTRTELPQSSKAFGLTPFHSMLMLVS